MYRFSGLVLKVAGHHAWVQLTGCHSAALCTRIESWHGLVGLMGTELSRRSSVAFQLVFRMRKEGLRAPVCMWGYVEPRTRVALVVWVGVSNKA